MPRYEYRCEMCRLMVEVVKPMSQRERPENCPACGAALRRTFTMPEIYYPGRAWGKRDGWWDYVFPTMKSIPRQ